MSVVRQIPKVSQKKVEIALEKTLNEKVKYFRDYSIRGDVLRIYFDIMALSYVDAAEHLALPSLKEIFDVAKSKYKNFKYDQIRQVEYFFADIRFRGFTNINVNFSNVNIRSCNFDNLHIYGGNKITLYDCDIMVAGSNDKIDNTFEIITQKIKIQFNNVTSANNINLIAKEIDLGSYTVLSGNNITVTGDFLTVNKSRLEANNINLTYNLIDTKESSFRANDKIEIYSQYADAVENVDAKQIFYNDIDITNSDGIAKPKLMSKLVDELSALRDLLKNTIDKDVEEVAKTRKQNLEESPITKILSRKNT